MEDPEEVGHAPLMVNKIDRPNTIPTVRAICKFAVYLKKHENFSGQTYSFLEVKLRHVSRKT